MQDQSLKMNSRSGLPVRTIITAVFLLLSVYLLYIYNASQNRLHDAELTGSRYRREAEERVNEIQGLIAAKDDFQERCEADKRELNNRLKSMSQKHSMLQSQNTEVEADFMKLKQDMENLRSEHAQTENQHAEEYQNLKLSKEKEVASLTDQIAHEKQQSVELQNTIQSLQAKIQNYEAKVNETDQAAKKNLLDQNAQLQMMQYQQQKQLDLQKQNEANAKQAQILQEAQKKMAVVSEKQPLVGQGENIFKPNALDGAVNVDTMNQAAVPGNTGAGNIGAGNGAPAPANIFNPGSNLSDLNGNKQVDNINNLNAMNAAKPPSLTVEETFGNIEKEAKEGSDTNNNNNQEPKKQEVNPNDLQQGQLLEPLKHDGAEEDGENRESIREAAMRREKEAEKEDESLAHPLNLKDMQRPLGAGLDADNKEQGGVVGQQEAPVMEDQQTIKKKKPGENKVLDDDQSQYYQNREEDSKIDHEEGVLDQPIDKQEQDDPSNAWRQFNLDKLNLGALGKPGEENEEDIDDDKFDEANPADAQGREMNPAAAL